MKDIMVAIALIYTIRYSIGTKLNTKLPIIYIYICKVLIVVRVHWILNLNIYVDTMQGLTDFSKHVISKELKPTNKIAWTWDWCVIANDDLFVFENCELATVAQLCRAP